MILLKALGLGSLFIANTSLEEKTIEGEKN